MVTVAIIISLAISVVGLLASIINFQILAALGFAGLGFITLIAVGIILEARELLAEDDNGRR